MRVPAPPTYEPSYKPVTGGEHRVPAPVAPSSYEPVYQYGIGRKKREANSTENDDYYEDESYYSSNEDSD